MNGERATSFVLLGLTTVLAVAALLLGLVLDRWTSALLFFALAAVLSVVSIAGLKKTNG